MTNEELDHLAELEKQLAEANGTIVAMLQTSGESVTRWKAEYDELEMAIQLAIDILDGNADVIDWRNKDEPELLRKLCEHLEAQCGRSIPENDEMTSPRK